MAPGYPDLVPTLTDGVVTLRALRESDLPAVVEQSRDPETARWTTVPRPYGPADAAAFLELTKEQWLSGERSSWVVEHEGTFAGLVAHRARGDKAVEISFATHPAQRGQGLMSRAVRLVCEQAASTGAEVILWHAQVGNFASRKVAWRNGFRISSPLHQTRRGELVEVWAGSLAKGAATEPDRPWQVPVPLEGDAVRLRPFRADDAESMPDVLDESASRFMSGAMPTREEFDRWLLARTTRSAEGESIVWAIADPGTDALLGGLQLFRLGHPMSPGSAMVGFWLLESARGKGMLGAALELAIGHAFTPTQEGGLGLDRLESECALDNLGSARALRRAGFTLVGTERDALVEGGTHLDRLLFDLTVSDDRDTQRAEPARVPVLETARFRLRPWRETDVPGPDEGPDAASLRFMPAGAQPTAENFTAWFRRKRRQGDEGDVHWCIADTETDHALGTVSIFRLGSATDRFQGEVGYWLHPPARGRGVLPEVLPPVLDHGFRSAEDGGLGLVRLYAETDLTNAPSRAVLQRVGFRQWGTDRMAYRNGMGELTGGAYFELLATDSRTDQRAVGRPAVDEVTLDGDRVRLRPWREDDAPRVVEACTEKRTRHWLAGLPETYSEDDAQAYLARCHAHASDGTGLCLAMADPEDDRAVGSIAVMGLGGEDATMGEIGYWSHPGARGRGVMTEAVARIVRHAFAPVEDGGLGLRRLVLRAAKGNTASQHVAEQNGFVRTGLQRQAEHLGDDTWDDLVDYDLLATEWQAR